MAAREVSKTGKRVLIVDKGKSVGGRMATRRIGDGAADHGAQFFTVRAPQFRALLNDWLSAGIAFEWSRGWSDGSLVSTRDGHPRYAINGGMIELAKKLAVGLDVRLKVEVTTINRLDGGWDAQDSNGNRVSANAVLLTAPVPQSLKLLDAGRVVLTSADRAALEEIDYLPSVTALLHIEGWVNLPAPGAIQRLHAPVTWIADNRQKRISPVTVLTMQASPGYSHQLWDKSDDDILRSLRVDLMPFLGDNARVGAVEIKRWRYAQPGNVYPGRYLLAADQASPLMFAGDAFGGPRVEGAVLSGLAAGDALNSLV